AVASGPAKRTGRRRAAERRETEDRSGRHPSKPGAPVDRADRWSSPHRLPPPSSELCGCATRSIAPEKNVALRTTLQRRSANQKPAKLQLPREWIQKQDCFRRIELSRWRRRAGLLRASSIPPA